MVEDDGLAMLLSTSYYMVPTARLALALPARPLAKDGEPEP
jgi:hypothetical protein